MPCRNEELSQPPSSPSKRLQITYLHYVYGENGSLLHVRQLAAAVEKLGHAITVHSLNLAPVPQVDATSNLRDWRRLRDTLKPHLSRYIHEPKELIWNARYFLREKRLLERTRPDVLLVRDHLLTASCVPVAWRLDLPLVIELNSPAVESRLYYDDYFHLPWIPEWLEAWKLKCADAITVVSSALKEHVVQQYRVPPEAITVAPNGADLGVFHPDMPADAAIPAAFRSGPVVGFIGSFQKWHGCDYLIRLINDVASAHGSVRFILVGEGPGVAAVRSATAHLRGRILFTGYVPHDRVPGLVATFDIGVMPESNFYGSPLKVIEWMAAGKAVVAPRYGPLEDVIQDEVDGLLFEPRNADAMVRSVLRLLAEPKLRASLGKAAAERARRSLSWTQNAQRVVGACRNAIQRHPSARKRREIAGSVPKPDSLLGVEHESL